MNTWTAARADNQDVGQDQPPTEPRADCVLASPVVGPQAVWHCHLALRALSRRPQITRLLVVVSTCLHVFATGRRRSGRWAGMRKGPRARLTRRRPWSSGGPGLAQTRRQWRDSSSSSPAPSVHGSRRGCQCGSLLWMETIDGSREMRPGGNPGGVFALAASFVGPLLRHVRVAAVLRVSIRRH